MTLKEHATLAHGHEPFMVVATHFKPDDSCIEVFLGWSRGGYARDLGKHMDRAVELMQVRGITSAFLVELRPISEELRPEAACGICGWDPYESEKEVAG